jgi:uncharacterized protein (DUF2062 family)
MGHKRRFFFRALWRRILVFFRYLSRRGIRRWWRLARFEVRRRFRQVFGLDDTAHRLALGFTIGWMFSWIAVPAQMYLGGFVAWMLRGNIPAAMLGAWCSNPLTMLPYLWCSYTAGAWCCGKPAWIGWKELQKFVHDVESAFTQQGLWDGMQSLGTEVLRDYYVPILVGGAIMAVLTAIPTYGISRHFAKVYHARNDSRRLQWASALKSPDTLPPARKEP